MENLFFKYHSKTNFSLNFARMLPENAPSQNEKFTIVVFAPSPWARKKEGSTLRDHPNGLLVHLIFSLNVFMRIEWYAYTFTYINFSFFTTTLPHLLTSHRRNGNASPSCGHAWVSLYGVRSRFIFMGLYKASAKDSAMEIYKAFHQLRGCAPEEGGTSITRRITESWALKHAPKLVEVWDKWSLTRRFEAALKDNMKKVNEKRNERV